MNKHSLVFIVFIFIPVFFYAQEKKSCKNRWENNLREGLWIEYYDTLNQFPMHKGRYHLGLQKGTWKYYYEDKVVRKKEKIGKEFVRTRYYFPNGKLKSKGKAIIDRSDPVYLHYFYQGTWIYYNEKGKPEYQVEYLYGDQVGEKKFLKK